jgi:hypothetical protein
MARFQTVFSSISPMDCHILKSRFETDGIHCFIYDENMVWVNPFYANAIGWVKLKVPEDQYESAMEIIKSLKRGMLLISYSDANEKEVELVETLSALEEEIAYSNIVLDLKFKLRENPELFSDSSNLKVDRIEKDELRQILLEEEKYQEFNRIEFHFRWKDFWYELFDPSRCFFKYLRSRPTDYYIDKELMAVYSEHYEDTQELSCTKCESTNIRRGYAMDIKWDIPYILMVFFIFYMAPPVRKNYHCFECGADFRASTKALNNLT